MLFVCSMLLLFTGHFLKVLRWSLLLNPYETIRISRLISSLSVGYVANFLLPFRMGEVARAVIAAKKSKSGVIFTFATVLIDRLFDYICVFFIFLAMFLFRIGNTKQNLQFTVITYASSLLVIFILISLAYRYRRKIKQWIAWSASLFNRDIQLRLLFFGWSVVTLTKDIGRRINKLAFGALTVLMWIGYLASYILLGEFLAVLSPGFSTSRLIYTLFSSETLWKAQISQILQLVGRDPRALWTAILYIISPIVIMLSISLILRDRTSNKTAVTLKKKLFKSEATIQVLPFTSFEERLQFLTRFFTNDEDSAFLNSYIEMNRNIFILEDFTGGSRATTIKAMSNESVFYRKYIFGEESLKLRDQVEWIRSHPFLPLPAILNETGSATGFLYDMDYDPYAVGLFTHIHSIPDNQAWQILTQVICDIREKIHQPTRKTAVSGHVDNYISAKIMDNIKKIQRSKAVSSLSKYSTLLVNGEEYPNFSHYTRYFTRENLEKVFQNDFECDIHGDLTIENIIYSPSRPSHYYLIDPNTGNALDSPYIDFAKLMQSLHYRYEFLQKKPHFEQNGSEIKILLFNSSTYDFLWIRYLEYLQGTFDDHALRSIFYHELVNILRLLPYKIERDSRNSAYYINFLVVLADMERNGWL